MVEPVQAWPPNPGTYATRLVRGGPRVACKIWFGPPVIDGEELDRSPDWRVAIDGETDTEERLKDNGVYTCRVALAVTRVWPWCAGEPITEQEYEFLLRRAAWAREHAPEHFAANPREKIDLRAMAPIRP